MTIKKQLQDLPMNTVKAAVNDPFLRVFWCWFAFIAIICVVFR